LGFLDLAWAVSFQKDNTKVKILQDPTIEQPTLEQDEFGYTVKVPQVKFLENKKMSFLGYQFNLDLNGKIRVGRLFRAAVLHLTTHTLTPLPKENVTPCSSDSFVEAFAKSLVRDTYVNGYLQAWYPDRLADVSYANTLVYYKVKASDRIFAASTRVMSAILCKINVGSVKGLLASEEQNAVDAVVRDLQALKETFMISFAGEKIELTRLFEEKTKSVKELLEPFGPFLESPSFNYMEDIGRCSILSGAGSTNDLIIERVFRQSLEALGNPITADVKVESLWRKEHDAEALQAFNAEQNQKEKKAKIIAKITPLIGFTRLKGVEIPDEDYTQYLRARSLVQGASRRLLERLREALNLLDEDPRQEMGTLDLSAVIQAVASNKPATDVFTLDEFLKQSFAWAILFDASASMKVRGEFSRALAIAVAEAAKELMNDPTSWTLFAFSDKLNVLKDSNESYSKRVRARIGGLKFDGLTYIPDAIYIAGKMLAKRFEEQRVLLVISDGWPYGYKNMPIALKENVDELLKKGVIVIGIGAETDRMDNFFRLNASVYTQKDLVKKFANVYIDASQKAIET
jgi:Mg-chelatase subunit ChlD